MKYFVIFLIMAGFIGFAYAHHDGTLHPTPNTEMARENYTLANLEWSQANFRVTNGTGTAKIIVTDPDMNKISNAVDTLNVSVFSDSFREGISLKLYETEKNSGIFERTFTLSEKRSAPSVLYVRFGDTATVTYTDTTLPPDNPLSEIVMTETTLIGHTGPPLERVPASSFRIQNMQGDIIKIPIIPEDKQIQLVADIKNQQNKNQSFVFFMKIQDEKKTTISLSWIIGTLTPLQSFSPSQSWIPQNSGKYTATLFVWQSFDNPSALSPPLSLDITVKG
jgi:hypothetical protein